MRNIKTDSAQYKDLQTPTDTDGKRRILRSLMNIHMPGKMDDSILGVQDEYLQECIRENGSVTPENIPLKEGVISVWHLADVILIIGVNFQNQVSRH